MLDSIRWVNNLCSNYMYILNVGFLDEHKISHSPCSGGTMLQQLLLVTLGLMIVVLPVDSRQKV